MATDFTIADVLAWARTKPADEEYNYTSISNCAACQFLRDTGRATNPRVGPQYWTDADIRHSLDHRINMAVLGEDRPGAEALWTFGQLVARLEALCPETIVTPSEWTRLDAYLADIEQVDA